MLRASLASARRARNPTAGRRTARCPSLAPLAGQKLRPGRARVPAHLRPVLRLERPFLHAMRLGFTHPTDTQRRLEFTAPLPDDLQGVLADIEARLDAQDDRS